MRNPALLERGLLSRVGETRCLSDQSGPDRRELREFLVTQAGNAAGGHAARDADVVRSQLRARSSGCETRDRPLSRPALSMSAPKLPADVARPRATVAGASASYRRDA